MWAPWQLSLAAGSAAGCATALANRSVDIVSLLTALGVAVLVGLLVRLGLWASKRPRLPAVPALGVAGASALVAFLAGLPIATHAELMDMPATLESATIPTDAYLVGIAALVAPAVIAFIIGRMYGVPPNTSFERTREG